MSRITSHLSRCFVTGIVALLPVAGIVLVVVWLESKISGSWLANQPWYLPGMGLLLTVAAIYLLGLTLTSLLGRWVWKAFDRLMYRLPLLGRLYSTLKQILGYSEGEDALFREVVFIRSSETQGGQEIALVTNRHVDASGREMLTLFVPYAPTPTVGRLILIDSKEVIRTTLRVNEALKALVSVGITPPLGEFKE